MAGVLRPVRQRRIASVLYQWGHDEQLGDIHPEDLSESIKSINGDVGFAAFELGDIGPVALSHFSKFLLAQSVLHRFPKAPNIAADSEADFGRGRRRGLGHMPSLSLYRLAIYSI